jgi:hypothetical protein
MKDHKRQNQPHRINRRPEALLTLLAAALLSAGTAFAGTFTNSLADATKTTGITLNTSVDPGGLTYPIIQNGELVLVYQELNLGSISMVLDDLDAGKAIDSFTATFQLQLGPGTSPPADGFSFSFGPDILSYTTASQEGPGTMNAGITVEFDTYRNLDVTPWDDIGIDVKIAGTEIAWSAMYTAATLVDGTMHPVVIQLNKNGTLNLTWNGQVIFTNLILTGWSPTNGQFCFGASTGGSDELCAMKNLGVTTTVAPPTTTAPTITTPPQSVTVAEGAPVAFTVDCETDAPLTIQWAQNGTAIAGATNWVLTIPRADYVNNGAKYTCTIKNSVGPTTSSAATLTVTPSTAPPNVVSAAAIQNGAVFNVGIKFDKALDPVSAANAANYSVPGGTVSAATYSSTIPVAQITLGSGADPINAKVNNGLATPPTNSGVVLTVSGLTPGTGYTVTVNNVANDHGDKMTAAQTANFFLQQTYTLTDADVGPPTLAGSMTTQVNPFEGTTYYTVVGGGADIWNAVSYFNYAYTQVTGDFDLVVQVNSLIGPDSWTKAELLCDGFDPTQGVQGQDPFVAIMTTQEGAGVVQNDVELQDRPTASAGCGNAGMTPVFNPTYPNCWLRLTRVGSSFSLKSGTDMKTWTSVASYTDTAGAFGTKTLVGLAVTAHLDSDAVGGIATFSHFGSYPPLPVAITTQPAASVASVQNVLANVPGETPPTIYAPGAPVTAGQGYPITLSVAATGDPVFYQWYKNGTAITGANAATYMLASPQSSDAGTYTVKVYNSGYSVMSTSSVAITITPDTTPPVIMAGSALMNHAGTFDIGLVFNKMMDVASAATLTNYSLSSGTIKTVNYMTNSPSVLVTASGLTAGATVTLTVKNVADSVGNKIVTTNFQVNVSAMTWGEVGGEEMAADPTDYPGPAVWPGGFPAGYGVVAVATNAFDLYTDGWAEWNNYDESTFVYEAVTGDFDKKLEVVYQDASSQWARAGIVMREDLSVIGMNAATQQGDNANGNTPTMPTTGLAGRYQKIHVNPAVPTLTGPGTMGNNAWECNRRLAVGGGCSSPAVNGDNPLYPNAWVRIQRFWGTNVNIFRSDDGKDWVWMGQTVWSADQNAPAMPNTVYVGPEYSCEDGNITTATDRNRFLAQMRNYGNTWGPAPQVASRTYSIGVNFGANYGATLGTPITTSLAATDVAGIPGLKQKNWNNDTGTTGAGSVANLVADQNGTAVPTTAVVTYAAPNYWSTTGQTTAGETNNIWNGADAVLMNGYLDSGSPATTTVTITNIPAALTSGGYDVYVYACGSIGTRGGGYRIVDTAGNVLKPWVYAVTAWYAPDYYPVPDNTSITNYGVGNYIVFRGLNASVITIQASTDFGLGTFGRGMATPRTPINAVQLVAPSTAVAPPTSTVSIARSGTTIKITFTGNLYSAATVKGPWTVVTGATSPYTVSATGQAAFYRAGP